jgi:hypothetical protein
MDSQDKDNCEAQAAQYKTTVIHTDCVIVSGWSITLC